MGLVYADSECTNAREHALGSLRVRAMVDSGVMQLAMPRHVANQMKLSAVDPARRAPTVKPRNPAIAASVAMDASPHPARARAWPSPPRSRWTRRRPRRERGQVTPRIAGRAFRGFGRG